MTEQGKLPGEWSATGWRAPADGMQFEQWERVGEKIREKKNRAERKLSEACWQWGDWLNWGEPYFGERHAQALEETDYHPGSLHRISKTCAELPGSRRRERVTFWKHAEVLGLSEDDQDALLRLAEEQGWTTVEIRMEAAKLRRSASEGGAEQVQFEADPDGQETCPLCSGSGTVSHDRKEAYFKEEAGVY